VETEGKTITLLEIRTHSLAL